MELDLVEVDVAEVLREVALREAGRAARDAPRRAGRPAGTAPRGGRPRQLRQIVLNLVDNAIKYSPNGGTVTVSGARRLDVVEVRVADEGIGISVADQRNLFRKFFRADARMTRGIRGIGLGPLPDPRLRDGDGRPHLGGVRGGRRHDVHRRAAAAQRGSGAPARVGGGGVKVLLVDDEASIRLLCRVNLEAAGFTVVEAATRAEVLPARGASAPT